MRGRAPQLPRVHAKIMLLRLTSSPLTVDPPAKTLSKLGGPAPVVWAIRARRKIATGLEANRPQQKLEGKFGFRVL